MEYSERHIRITLEGYLSACFSKDQGVRLGESTVLSRKVHGNDSRTPGEIKIYRDQDAGKHYLRQEKDNLVLHMDVFHEPASLDPVYVARRIYTGVENYFTQLRDENRSEYSKEKVTKLTKQLAGRLILQTAGGIGNTWDFSNRNVELVPYKARVPQTHIHILFSLEPHFYDIVLFITDAAEQAILNQGIEIRRVDKIIHCEYSLEVTPRLEIGIELPGFNSPEAESCRALQNRLQVIANLASAFGTVEDAARFLESLTTTGNLFLGSFAKKHDDRDLKQTLLDLTNENLVKKGRFAYVLTEKGKVLRDFMREHQRELEAQVRKSIRRYPVVKRNYRTFRHSELKSRKDQLSDHKKVIALKDHSWVGDIAIPETIVNASVRSFIDGHPRMAIQKKDFMVYGKKSFSPIDTCIAIDCSGSMAGDKIRAVSYLAEYFLLTAREKISVIAFQEQAARVVVPFTRDYRKLQDGLRTIEPEGLTPLTKGILESIGHINGKRARNPLLILITDGIPNVPHWTIDAKNDALIAAKMIADNKIRLVCIGVIPNEGYMKELALIGKGNLYIVDELNKSCLVDVVIREWKQYKGSQR